MSKKPAPRVHRAADDAVPWDQWRKKFPLIAEAVRAWDDPRFCLGSWGNLSDHAIDHLERLGNVVRFCLTRPTGTRWSISLRTDGESIGSNPSWPRGNDRGEVLELPPRSPAPAAKVSATSTRSRKAATPLPPAIAAQVKAQERRTPAQKRQLAAELRKEADKSFGNVEQFLSKFPSDPLRYEHPLMQQTATPATSPAPASAAAIATAGERRRPTLLEKFCGDYVIGRLINLGNRLMLEMLSDPDGGIIVRKTFEYDKARTWRSRQAANKFLRTYAGELPDYQCINLTSLGFNARPLEGTP